MAEVDTLALFAAHTLSGIMSRPDQGGLDDGAEMAAAVMGAALAVQAAYDMAKTMPATTWADVVDVAKRARRGE
jgi:hypothetical protein